MSALHYAIVDKAGLFACIQGDQKWFQGDCTGWAVCSADEQWVHSVAESLPFKSTVVPMVQNKDFTFTRHDT